jgi:osmotically-inducible protein OsmY
MASDNRDRDNRSADDLDKPVVAVPVPINNTGSGFMPAVVPVEGVVDEANVDAGRDDHSGRGFLGFDSSDRRIDEELSDHLEQHSYIDTTNVTVTVNDGKVTLEGTVPDSDQKNYVEEVAAKIDGVTGIDNRLTIQKPQDTLLQNTSGKQ